MSNVIKLSSLVLVLCMIVPASANLVLHLGFDDANQVGVATVGDSLEAVGDAAYTASGRDGGGLLLDGDGDYLRLNDTDALPTGIPIGNSSYTVAAFIKTAVEGRNGIAGWGAPDSGQFCAIRTGTADFVEPYPAEDASFVNYSWGADYDCIVKLDPETYPDGYADNQWHHVAAVYDSAMGEKRFYFDGSQVGAPAIMLNTLNIADENFRLGSIHFLYNGNDVNESFTGTMDDVRIYDSALTETEISDLITPIVVEDIPGDANRDQKVDGSDVTILAGNWQVGVDGLQTATWEMGDFNSDGKVDGSDVTILAGNWQAGVTAAAASVPEPGTIALLISAMASLMIWRRVR